MSDFIVRVPPEEVSFATCSDNNGQKSLKWGKNLYNGDRDSIKNFYLYIYFL